MGQMVKLVFNFITIKKNLDKKEKTVDGRANSKRQGLGIDQRMRQSRSRKCLRCPKAGRPGQRADGKATATQRSTSHCTALLRHVAWGLVKVLFGLGKAGP